MTDKPDYTDWQQVAKLLNTAGTLEERIQLLTMLLTPDERDTMVARVNIFNELLKGDLSQRQISQMLGVGVATITRGSNELKRLDDGEKAWLGKLLSK
ncbi:trp operon repressor [Parasalinivibrio latis]|uniref:trp operon repressor n=1 Tax=Parasalinivibrio latis TaxID=2952610 RepID=UPI0030DEE9D7